MIEGRKDKNENGGFKATGIWADERATIHQLQNIGVTDGLADDPFTTTSLLTYMTRLVSVKRSMRKKVRGVGGGRDQV